MAAPRKNKTELRKRDRTLVRHGRRPKELEAREKATRAASPWTPKIEEEILALLAEANTIRSICQTYRISTHTIYDRLKTDEEWAKRWKNAYEQGNNYIRDEIKRRALVGVTEPIYHEGELIGRKRKYSDVLAMFLAKSRMPEFKDNQHEVLHSHSFTGAAERLAAKLTSIIKAGEASEDPEESD